MDENIISIINNAPNTSGCYIFKNKDGVILYIGKSKSLKNRLRSYYNGTEKRFKVERLINEAKDIELILTDNETEALILECNLIKKEQPRFNSDLKKNWSNYYLRIGQKEDFPPITVEKEVVKDGGKYYGIYNKQEYVESSIQLLNDIWKTPICNKINLDKIERPCIQYDMKKCVGPCGKINTVEYKKITKEIIKFFNSDKNTLLKNLEKQLKIHIENLEFEKAGVINTRLNNIKGLKRRIQRLDLGVDYKTAILFFRGYNENGVTIFYIEKEKILLATRISTLKFQEEIIFNFIEDVKSRKFIDENKYNLKYIQEIKCDKMFAKVNFEKEDSACMESMKKAWINYLEVE